MEWLESAPTWPDLAETVASMVGQAVRPPDALAQIEANLARVGQRFEWGDITAAEYRDKRERLQALRREATAAVTATEPRLAVLGLVAAWDGADAIVRRSLLWNLFSEIDITPSGVHGVLARSEVAAEVAERLKGWPGLDGAALRIRYA